MSCLKLLSELEGNKCFELGHSESQLTCCVVPVDASVLPEMTVIRKEGSP